MQAVCANSSAGIGTLLQCTHPLVAWTSLLRCHVAQAAPRQVVVVHADPYGNGNAAALAKLKDAGLHCGADDEPIAGGLLVRLCSRAEGSII